MAGRSATRCRHPLMSYYQPSQVARYRSPSNVSNGIYTSHHHTCQATYTISKDVCLSLTSLIGTMRRDRVGSVPPSHQHVSPVLNRHGRTDVISMKGALGGWSGSGPMHARRTTLDTGALGGRGAGHEKKRGEQLE